MPGAGPPVTCSSARWAPGWSAAAAAAGDDNPLPGEDELDLNGNGIPDVDEEPDPGSDLACPGSGTDATSANDEWNDNCVLRNGVTSYYTRGVQRILYCLGFNDSETQSLGDFADAQFGDGTRRAVEAFQSAASLTVDGVVGPQTWQTLQNTLESVADNPTEMDESYAVIGAREVAGCGAQVQFYREYEEDASGDQFFSGWKIADNPGSERRIEFSIRNPFR